MSLPPVVERGVPAPNVLPFDIEALYFGGLSVPRLDWHEEESMAT